MGCTWYILCTYLQLFSSLFTSALAYFVGQIVKNKGFQKIYTDMGGIWMIYGPYNMVYGLYEQMAIPYTKVTHFGGG